MLKNASMINLNGAESLIFGNQTLKTSNQSPAKAKAVTIIQTYNPAKLSTDIDVGLFW